MSLEAEFTQALDGMFDVAEAHGKLNVQRERVQVNEKGEYASAGE